MTWNLFTAAFLVLFVSRRGFELLLDSLQLRYLVRRPDKVPKHLEGKVDLDDIRKAVAYNIDKIRLNIVAKIADAAAVWIMIAAGFGLLERTVVSWNLDPTWAGLALLGALLLLTELFDLPFSLYRIFRIEERHGFNRTTIKAYFLDRFKSLFLNALLGGALLFLVLTLMEKGGAFWWVWAFFTVSVVQLLMMWIYPVVIMPWFNKFTPVPADLAEETAALAASVNFPLKQVFSMDGSRRSTHANAFIIGLVGARKIVLFDTLIEKVTRPQLLAVLAHELGHFKLHHLSKRILLTVGSMFGMFFLVSVLRDTDALYPAFGFTAPSDAAAVVIFSLIVTEAAAPFTRLLRALSRRDEYAADRFAVEATKSGDNLADALIALSKQNRSGPGAHPWYRSYYNSHPPLRDRLAAIHKHGKKVLERAEK